MLEEKDLLHTWPENEERNFSHFWAKVDFDIIDEKLKRFVILRNEMAMMAKDLGISVEVKLIEVGMKEPT